jgi:endo-1,4-beta-xylanase
MIPIGVTAASAETTVVTDFSHDFENGQAHGWTGNGVTVEPADVGSTAHGGSGVLSVHDKTGWGVALRDLRPVVQPGVEYTLSAYVRAAEGSGVLSMTVNAGTDYQNSGTYQVPVTDTGWTKLSRTYTAAAGQALPDPLQFYFETGPDYFPFYVDDVTMTHVEEGDPDDPKTLVSSDFEDATAQGWGPRGNVTVAPSTEQAHAGTHSLKTTGRTANWNGPSYDLLGKVAAGTQYTISAWVRMVSGTDTVVATVQKTVDGTQGWDSVTPRVTATDGDWVQLTGTWTAPADATELTLYVEGAAADSAYYLDDVLITYTGDAGPPTDPPLPAGLERVTEFGANPGNLRMYVHVPATLQEKAPIVVASHYCTGTASAFYAGSGFGVREVVQASDRLGFIMIFPESTRDGRCFDSASPQALQRDGGSDPVSVKSMIEYVQARYTTDPDRVFAIGASSGAMLTQTLLGNYPDVFAAGVSYMGVPHSCFATGSATNLWSSECAEGRRIRTAPEWGDLVRAAYPGYTGERPRIQMWHGTEDTTISFANLGEGVKEWTDVHGLSATPAATKRIEGSWDRSRYGTDSVLAPVEAIAVNGNGHDLPRPEMAPYALAFLGLDAPVEEPDTPPGGDGVQTLLEHGFENGTTQGWAARGGTEVVTTSTAAAHTGTRSLAVAGRTQNWNAPILNLLGQVRQGTTYTVSAWVRTPTDADARITLETRIGETPTYTGVSGLTAVAAGTWTQLSGTFMVADDVDFLRLYVETAGLEDFFVDDVKITYLPTKPVQTDIPSLGPEFAKYWPDTGAAVGVPQLVGDHATLLKKHFTSVTPENALKWDAIHPRPGVWNWAEADRIMALAKQNNVKVYGHVLAWHSQLPDWVFQDDAGNPLPVNAASKQVVLDRLSEHIRTVVGRYKGQIYAWDAVNEVIDDADAVTYRNSKYHQYTGLDFIRTAFRVAHEVDPAAELCINDYNSTRPVKRNKYFNLVKQLIDEGVPITCVGHQMHINIAEPAVETEETLGKFTTLGLRQRITELDVSVYDNDTDVFTEIPEANRAAQEDQYKAVFKAFLTYADQIDSVTFWGLADDRTWLSTFPITRLNTPLVFDRQLQAKPVFHTLIDLARTWAKRPGGPRTVQMPARPVVLPRSGRINVEVSLSKGWCLNRGAQIVAVHQTVGGAAGQVSAVAGAPLRFTPSSPAGVWSVYVAGADCAGEQYAVGAANSRLGLLTLVSPTAVTVRAQPASVRAGQPVTVSGGIRHLAAGEMAGWADASLVVEFKPRSGAYATVATVISDADGKFSYTGEVEAAGTYRVRFAGSADHAESADTVNVSVRK